MNTINLNDNVEIDLTTLIDTRLLVQANSGGGKSWLIRRILEQSHGKVQQIVLDLEGEFSTLREKYDYILAGEGGETPANPKSAALLARKLLELKVSAIINLYELNHLDRKRFVKLFLDSMVNARKELWHPCLVVIDEAHVFCPEKGQAESAGSVIDLATRGRKRGYCAVLATQRLSKLHKDAAAECNNKLIGRTGLDIDMKRASEELGFTGKEQYLSLRSLEAGEFFAYGPAISKEVTKITVGPVNTTHPKAGARILTQAIPPTEKIKSILSQLADLPEEAKKEEESIDSLKREIIELKRSQRVQNSVPSVVEIEKAIEPHLTAFRSLEGAYKDKIKEWETYCRSIMRLFISLQENVELLSREEPNEKIGAAYLPDWQKEAKEIVKNVSNKREENLKNLGLREESTIGTNVKNSDLTLAARRIYNFLYSNPGKEFTKIQLGAVTGYSPKSGGFNNSISQLFTRGLIKRNGTMISCGVADSSLVVSVDEAYTPEIWLQKLPIAPRKIYEYLWNHPTEEFTKPEIGEITGYSPTSGGFNNAISKLNALGLIKRLPNAMITLNQELLNL